MKKARVYFHGKTETVEQVISRTAAKLETAQRMQSFVESGKFCNTPQFSEAVKEQCGIINDRIAQITALCERARAAAVFEATLNILSEEATLVDLDKAFKKGDNNKWKIV